MKYDDKIIKDLKTVKKYLDIPLERKCVREDPSVGGNVKIRIGYRLHYVIAYALVLWDIVSLL